MILVIGGNGFVGQAICEELAKEKLSYAIPGRSVILDDDFYSRASAVINAAGYTGKPNVDACERNKLECLDGNVALPLRIAQKCEAYGVPMVHVSSGCIYWGSGNYKERDAPNFEGSFYSMSKWAGEKVLRGFDVRCMRIRMPFLDGRHPRCVIHKLSKYDKWIDGENSVTYLPDVGRMAVSLLNAPSGIYNATNPGVISNRQIAEYLGMTPKWWDWEEFYMAGHVARSFCTLDSSKIQSLLQLRDVHTIMSDIFQARAAA